jgi:hypothetical protein
MSAATFEQAPPGSRPRAPEIADGRGSDVDRLVRAPRALLADVVRGRFDLTSLARASLLVTLACGVAYGVVVGSFRGGVQIAYCAAKVPMLLLATLVIATPAFVALSSALGVRLGGARAIAIGLVAAARGALVLALLAPVQWLVQGWVHYHEAFMLTVVVAAVAAITSARAIFGAVALAESTHGPRVSRYAALGAVFVFFVVGTHSSWLMRPFLVRPAAKSVPFVRHVEGDFIDAFGRSLPSFAGSFRDPILRPCGGAEGPCK